MIRLKSAIMKSVLAVFFLSIFCVGAPADAAKWFVDGALGDVKPEDRVTTVTPQAVQVFVSFQRDGKDVPAAVRQIKPMVLDALKARGDFSTISDTPVPSGAMLNVVMVNIVNKEEIDKLKSKAFGAGLTFGLGSGFVATDRYTFTLEFVPATGKPSIKTSVDHAIHMKYGNTSEAISGTQVENQTDAAREVVTQAVSKGLNNIAADPAYVAYSAVTLPKK